jgi:hypothetical protein
MLIFGIKRRIDETIVSKLSDLTALLCGLLGSAVGLNLAKKMPRAREKSNSCWVSRGFSILNGGFARRTRL